MFLFILLVYLIKFSTQNCYEKIYDSETVCSSYYYDRCQAYNTNDFYELHCYLSDGNFQFTNQIHKLHVYSSDLKYVKRSFFNNLSKLQSIIMNADNIEDIETSAFDNLSNLTSLYLTNNNITRLNKFLSNTNVRTLDLSANNISYIQPDALETVQNLKLVLKGNKVTSDNFLTASCQELSSLDLSYNSISKFTYPDTCLKLINLNISFNHIAEFDVDLIKSKPLEILDLSFNNLSYIHGDTFKYFIKLEALYLRHNPLFRENNLPINLFQNNIILKRLYLSNTGIKILKIGTFAKLVNLTELDLSYNNISSLPKSVFYNLNYLKILYLNDNYLTYFEYRSTKSLQKINLDHNLWNCDILWDIIEKLAKNSVSVTYGTTSDTNHVNGISCTENTSINSSDQDGITSLKEEYRTFFSKVQDNVESIVKKQENLYNTSITLNENSSKTFWSNVQQRYTDFLKYFQNENRKTVNQVANAFHIIENNTATYWTNYKDRQETSLNNIQTKYQTMLDQLPDTVNSIKQNTKSNEEENNSSTYWTNLNGGQETFLKIVQNKFQTMLNQVNDAVKSIKNMPNQMNGSMSEVIKFNDENSRHYKAILIGVYGLSLFMILIWTVLIIMKFKYRRNYKSNTEENPLTTFHA